MNPKAEGLEAKTRSKYGRRKKDRRFKCGTDATD